MTRTDLQRKIDSVGLSERTQARHGGLFVPRLQVVGPIDVGVSAQPSLLQERFEAHAAGQDQGHLPSLGLAIPAQPAQERVRRPLSFERDAVLVILEHPVDEDRQFVDCENNRPAAGRQNREYRIASLLPVSGVDPCTQVHPQVCNGQFLYPVAGSCQKICEAGLNLVPRSLCPLRLNADLGDRVRRVAGSLQIDKKIGSISPASVRRRSNSRTKLVLPMRRCAVCKVWVPSRTRSSSASSSISRSKKRSPRPSCSRPYSASLYSQPICWQQHCWEIVAVKCRDGHPTKCRRIDARILAPKLLLRVPQ